MFHERFVWTTISFGGWWIVVLPKCKSNASTPRTTLKFSIDYTSSFANKPKFIEMKGCNSLNLSVVDNFLLHPIPTHKFAIWLKSQRISVQKLIKLILEMLIDVAAPGQNKSKCLLNYVCIKWPSIFQSTHCDVLVANQKRSSLLFLRCQNFYHNMGIWRVCEGARPLCANESMWKQRQTFCN